MKVLLFHPTLLPPRDYGGIERVVLWLAKGLLERGHDVWVGALSGSQLPHGARLLEIDPNQSSATDLLKKLPAGLDVVHFMAPPESGVLEQLGSAGVVTIHGNGKPGERFPRNTLFLSQDHAKRHGATAFVHNGIDPKEVAFQPDAKTESYLFLSKTSWKVKNLAGAMRLCSVADVPLRIAGGNRPFGLRLEALFRSRFIWEGKVSGEKKANLLTTARGLVFPVLWSEPFGLVVVEALMAGTPVLAPRRGSLPELVHSGVGALLESEEAWIEALKRPCGYWDPRQCREWALSRFHYRNMAEGYEKAYRKVVGGEDLNAVEPETVDSGMALQFP